MTTKKPKSYDTGAALVAIALCMSRNEEPDVRAELKAGTDIPEDRLDFAAHECEQIIDGLRMVVGMIQLAYPDPEDQEKAIRQTIAPGCTWIDDDKRNLTVNAYVEGLGAAEGPLVTVKTKLKPMGEATA